MNQGVLKFGKKDEIYGSQTLFRELGYYILRLEHYERCLQAFNEAIKHTPNDIRALVGRSRSRAKTSLYKEAIEDINKALSLDPNNLIVLAEKALNTYLSCEFEDGLVQNTRLVPIRQKPEHFLLGVMHCSNAIETCIGEPAGRPLRDYFKMIRKLAWEKNRELLEGHKDVINRKRPFKRFFIEEQPETAQTVVTHKKKNEKTKKKKESKLASIKDSLYSHTSKNDFVPPYLEEFPFHPQQNYTTNIENFMAEKYLESMYHDKNFLKKIETEPGASCPNRKGSEKIKFLAKRGYKMVAYEQELLRTRRPFYHIKYKEGSTTANLKERQAQELYIQQKTTKKEADLLFEKLETCFREKHFKALLDQAEKLRKYCDSKPKRLLPDKDTYLEKIFKIVRQGYFQLHRLNLNQYPWDQIKRIHMAFGLPISREPSADSVIEDSKTIFIDHKKQLKIMEKRLKEQAQSTDEICWCYYEMCKSSIELKQYEIGKIYAKHCLQLAKQTNNLEWIFNATMLAARIDIQVGNKSDARLDLNYAKELAEELKNVNLTQYVEKCFDVLESIHPVDHTGTEEITKREQKIIGIMHNVNLKNEFAHLFRLMASLPASRRMPVIPGVTATDDADKQKQPGRRKSIARAPFR